MAPGPSGAERKVMLTWENTSLDSKAWERNNRSFFPSIKNSAAEWFFLRKGRQWQLFLSLFPTEDNKMLLSLPKVLPSNLPTEPHPSWAVSNVVFQLYSLALMPVLPKGHKHPRVCHREAGCGLCTTPKLLSSNTEPHNHFKHDYNPSKENQTNTNSAD